MRRLERHSEMASVLVSRKRKKTKSQQARYKTISSPWKDPDHPRTPRHQADNHTCRSWTHTVLAVSINKSRNWSHYLVENPSVLIHLIKQKEGTCNALVIVTSFVIWSALFIWFIHSITHASGGLPGDHVISIGTPAGSRKMVRLVAQLSVKVASDIVWNDFV